MALPNEDIWQKFDLFGDQKVAKHVESNLIDTIPEFAGDCFVESNSVPDISDFIFDFGQSDSFENMDFSNEPLLNSVEERFNSIPSSCGRVLDFAFIDLENLESSEIIYAASLLPGLFQMLRFVKVLK